MNHKAAKGGGKDRAAYSSLRHQKLLPLAEPVPRRAPPSMPAAPMRGYASPATLQMIGE